MAGHRGSGVRLAHADSPTGGGGPGSGLDRAGREDCEQAQLAPEATRAVGAGNRDRPEEPDPWRTCFERDRDRILHATAFRRLAGKTQVFVFPDDHQRTRLTHALEVAQVATGIARACRLNVALTEAIALGHDCGHGPGGHASEDALSPYLDGGFDHAPWGADVSLSSLNLCRETLDGVRNHSWSRPAPSTPEGEVVSWADRIAYVCHDFEDAVASGIVTPSARPELVRRRCGDRRSQQLGAFIDEVVATVIGTGTIGMGEEMAEALAAFRSCNYERIYLRPSSVAQGEAVVGVLRALVEHYADHPHLIPHASSHQQVVADLGTGRSGTDQAGTDQAHAGRPSPDQADAGQPSATWAAVDYVAGMTDRFAFRQAVAVLGWDPRRLPAGIGVDQRL
jgi:dGTPase